MTDDARYVRPDSAAKNDGPNWTSRWNVGNTGYGDWKSGCNCGVPFTSADQHSAKAAVTDAPVDPLRRLVIDDLMVSADTNMTVTFYEETTNTVVAGPYFVLARQPIPLIGTVSRGKRLTTVNKRLMVQTSVSGNITVECGYHEE